MGVRKNMEIMFTKKQLFIIMVVQMLVMLGITLYILFSKDLNLMYSVIVVMLAIGFFINFKMFRDG